MGKENNKRPEKFTVEEMSEAIKKYKFKSAVAKALGCHITTVTRYVDKYDELAEILKEQRDGLLDLAEFKLMEKVRAGDTASIIFVLKTLGKDRGYRTTPQVAIQQNVSYVVPTPAGKLTDEEWTATYKPKEQKRGIDERREEDD